MRLVPGHVEVAHAEGEVDGIEVFERRGQERKVKREEDDRDGSRAMPNAKYKMRTARFYTLHFTFCIEDT